MAIRQLVLLLCLLTVSVHLSPDVVGQEETYAKGDKIRAKYAGEVITGKVVGTKISGFVEVEFDFRGKKLLKALPLTQILEDEAPATAPAPNAPVPNAPAGTPKGKPAANTTGSRSATGTGRSAPSKPGGSPERETRLWTDSTGKFKIEAKYDSLNDGVVHLIKPDGTLTKIPLDKLSDDDRALAERLANGPDATGKKPVPTKLTASTVPVKTTPVDWTGIPEPEHSAKGAPEPMDFKLEPDVSTDPPGEFLDRPYAFGSKNPSRNSQLHRMGFFERAESLMIDPLRNQAIIVLNHFPPGEEHSIFLVKIDLKDGKLSNALFPSYMKIFDYQSASKRYLGSGNFFVHPQVDDWKVFGVWAETGTALEQQGGWSAMRGSSRIEGEPYNAKFAGEKYAVLTTYPWNVLTVWDIEEGRPLYQRQMGHGNVQTTISANGKYLAYVDDDRLINMLDLPTGNLLGRLPIKNMSSMAFDPSGRYFATASDMRVTIYDFQEGRISQDFYLSRSVGAQGGPRSAGLRWVGEGYLLTDAGCLIDIKNATILWRYALPSSGGEFQAEAVYSGGRYWYVMDGDDRQQIGLFGVQIPHPDALAAAEKIDPNAKILKSGVRVRISLNISTTTGQLAAIMKSLNSQLEAAGMIADDTSDLVLTGSTSTGTPVSGTYHFSSRFGGGGSIPDQQVTSTPQIATLKLSRGGTVYWKSESVVGGFIPPMIILEEGQSAQSYVDSLSKPDFGFFERAELPTTLSEPAPLGAYGFSELTTRGIIKGAPPANW